MMFDNDTHAPGSVDRVLTEQMVRLCSENKSYLYNEYTPINVSYIKESWVKLEACIEKITVDGVSSDKRIESIIRFTTKLADKVASETIEDMTFGGTEEEIIDRGSDWGTDIARVTCSLCQIVAIPYRIINLYNTN